MHFFTHWCCSVHPDDDTLLVGGNFPVDVNTLLDVEQHGHQGHEGEDGVEDDPKKIQLYSGEKQERLHIMDG